MTTVFFQPLVRLATSCSYPFQMNPADEVRVRDLLRLHGHKLRIPSVEHNTTDRCAYLLFLGPDGSLPLDAHFVRTRPSDVLELKALDVEKRSVQWLMKQMHSYDPATEVLAGAVLPSREVLADVMPRCHGPAGVGSAVTATR